MDLTTIIYEKKDQVEQLEAAAVTSSIARAVEYKSAGSTSLRVSFASAYNTGSSNLNANLG